MATPPTSYGYPGSVNAAALATWLPAVAAARFSVIGKDDWRVTVQGGLDRGIRINAGTGTGDGIMDITAEYETMALPLVESGSRWFLIARRRNWAVPATTAPVAIAGTATKALPARSDTPGVESDQPLALCRVQAGQTVVQEIIDLRCWAGNGGLIAADKLALDYLDRPGADVLIGATTWRYSLAANGAWGWVEDGANVFGIGAALAGGTPPAGTKFLIQSGTFTRTTDSSGYSRFSWPKPFPNGLLSVVLTAGDDWANGSVAFFNVAGRTALWGSAGTGNLTEVVYTMQGSNASGNNWGKIPNRNHRVNYVAIGW